MSTHGADHAFLVLITIVVPVDIMPQEVTIVRVVTIPRKVIRVRPPRTKTWVVLKQGMIGRSNIKNNSEIFEDCGTHPILEHHETSKVDSGCICDLLLVNAPCHNKTKSTTPFHVIMSNIDTIDETHITPMDIPELSEGASVLHVFP
jgi:hypothetical protein